LPAQDHYSIHFGWGQNGLRWNVEWAKWIVDNPTG
jgi:hypothetical protein